MPRRLLLFVAVALSQGLLVQGGVATVTAHDLTTPDYVLGSAPTELKVTVSLADGVDTSGDTVKIIFSKAIMEDAATPVVTVAGGSSPVFSGWATTAGGTQITGTLSSGSITSTSVTLTITNSFVAYPSTGVVIGTAEAASSSTGGDSTGSSYDMFNVISAPTIALTTTNYYVGTTPSQLDITVEAPWSASTSDVVKVTLSEAVFAQSVTQSAASANFNNYVSDSTGKYIDADLAAGKVRGTSLTLSFSGTLLTTLPANIGDVTIDISIAGVDVAKAVTGFGTILLAAMGADPVARFGDTERAFELPPNVLTPLVVAPELSIYGSVFEGGGPWEQWFNRIVLTNPEQDRYLEIRMCDDLLHKNSSRIPRHLFHTLDVTMGYGDVVKPTATTKLHQLGEQVPKSFLGYDIAFHTVTRHDAMQFATIGRFPRECAHLAGPSMHFYICSAPAAEYYGHLSHLTVKYAHLDMVFLQVKTFNTLTGLLPELWGVQPMSEVTRSYLLKKDDDTNALASDAVIATATVETASVGGIGAENLTKVCEENTVVNLVSV